MDKKISVINKRKRTIVLGKLKDNLYKLNAACLQLRKVDDIFQLDSVAGVKKISSKWLRNYIDGIISTVNKDKRFTTDFKKGIKESWETVWEDAHELCDTIASIAQFDKIALLYSDGMFTYDPKEMESFADNEAQVTLTPKQMEYLNLIQGVCDSLNKAVEFENKNNWLHTIENGTNIPHGSSWEHVDFLRLINAGGEGQFEITPDMLIMMYDDGIIGEIKR